MILLLSFLFRARSSDSEPELDFSEFAAKESADLLVFDDPATDPELDHPGQQGILTRLTDLWNRPVVVFDVTPSKPPLPALDDEPELIEAPDADAAEWEPLALPPSEAAAVDESWVEAEPLSEEERYVIQVEVLRNEQGQDFLRFFRVAGSVIAATGAAISSTDEYRKIATFSEESFPRFVEAIQGIPVDRIKQGLVEGVDVIVPITQEAASRTVDLIVVTAALTLKVLQVSGRVVMYVASSGLGSLKRFAESDSRRYQYVRKI